MKALAIFAFAMTNPRVAFGKQDMALPQADRSADEAAGFTLLMSVCKLPRRQFFGKILAKSSKFCRTRFARKLSVDWLGQQIND